jgi:predicted MFS family arabinose efflux permease
MSAAIVGALFGPVLGGVASVIGQAVAFGTAGLIAVALAVWAFLTSAPPPARPQPLQLFVRALRNRRIVLSVWFVVLPALLFGTMGVLAPLRLEELGFSAVAIGVLWLCTAAVEATANPVVGRITDRVGRIRPMMMLALGSAVAAAALPWPNRAAVLALLVVAAGITFGSFWTPGMALLSDEAEARGLEYAYAFALINIAWAPGQALGAAGGGGLAEVTSDAVPYLLLSGAALITFAVLWRSESSS